MLVLLVIASYSHAECFNTRVWSTPSSVRFAPPEQDCTVWDRDMRTVWSSIAVSGAVAMHDQYSTDPAHQFVERFSLPAGDFIDSVALQDASPIDTAFPSMCETNYDLFIYTGAGRIDHYDLLSGRRRTSTHYTQLDDSDRVALACTGQRVFVSVPAAQAVWELAPADGLLVHVLARIPSPGAMSVHENTLYVVSGRPASVVYAFNLAANNSASVWSTKSVAVRDIVINGDGTVIALSDQRVTTQLTEKRRVGVDRIYAPLLHELLTPTVAVRNGVVVDIYDGSAIAPPASNLTNQGNVATLSYTPVMMDESLVLLDSTGELAEFFIVDECAIAFQRYLPPMAANAGLRVLDVSSSDGATLYNDEATGETWVRLALDDQDTRLDTSVVSPVHGLVCATPVPRACLMSAGEPTIHCYDLQSPDIVDIAIPADASSLHWNERRSGLVTFVVGTDEVTLWQVDLLEQKWRESCVLDTPPTDIGLDLLHWHTHEVAPGAFMAHWAPGVDLLIDENCTLVRRYDGNPSGVHTSLVWVNGRNTDEAVCVPLNSTWPVIPRRWNKAAERAFEVWLNVGIIMLLAGCCCCIFFATGIACRTGWYMFLFRRDKKNNSWQQMEQKRRVGLIGMIFCNRAVESALYGCLSCCPSVAERVTTSMQRHFSPPVYSSTDLAAGAPVSGEDADTEPETNWSNVAIDDDEQSASAAARG